MSNFKEAGTKKCSDILDAALRLGLKYGLAGITVESIARDAYVAKPTVYKYFPNKEAIYQGVVERLIVNMRTAFTEALASKGALSSRVSAALIAKHKEAAKFLGDSPHAEELYSVHNRFAGAQFKELEGYIESRLTTALKSANKKNPKQTAQLIIAASQGIASRWLDYKDFAWGIERMVHGLLATQPTSE
jgi:AcrR family transcriptional regulator